MVSEEGLHAADDEIMVSEGGLHAADDEILCQKNDFMLQMMKYGARRRVACCR